MRTRFPLSLWGEQAAMTVSAALVGGTAMRGGVGR